MNDDPAHNVVESGLASFSTGKCRELEAPAVRDRLFRLAYRFLWNREDAEDAVQETLSAALEKSSQLREADKWWGWLCQIAVRQCHWIGRRKTRRRRHEVVLAEPLDGLGEEGGVVRGDRAVRTDELRTAGEKSELKTLVRCLLDELPRRQREVLVLRHLEEMPFEEIGRVLSMSPVTARVHAQKGRERLLEMISSRHPELAERPAGEVGERK